jgi:hypothetical protein
MFYFGKVSKLEKEIRDLRKFGLWKIKDMGVFSVISGRSLKLNFKKRAPTGQSIQ